MLLAALRFWRLGEWSLWLDEALTLADSRKGWLHENPLGYVLFGGFYDLFSAPPSEFFLRFPAAVFGFLSVPATWWAFRPFAGARRASVAALIVASSSWHLYWSQNARFYTLVLLLGLVAGGCVLRGLLRGSWRKLAIGLAIVAVAALAQPSAAFLFGALLVAPWLGRLFGEPIPERARAAWRLYLVLGVAALLLSSRWVTDVWSLWSTRAGSASTAHLLLTCGYLVTPLLGLAALFGGARSLLRRERGVTTVLFVVLAYASAAVLASFFVRVSAQYVFVLLPWIALLAAVPFRETGRWGRLRWAWLLVVCAPMWVDSTLYFGWRNGDRPHWREAYRYVFENKRWDDLVLGMEAPVGEYYLDAGKWELRDWRHITWLDGHRSHVASAWARYPRRTWLIVNHEQMHDWSTADRARMQLSLERDCRLVREWQIGLTPRNLSLSVYLME